MKLLQYLVVSFFFWGLSVAKPVKDDMVKIDMSLLSFLYDSYDQHKEKFVGCLPSGISIDQCRRVLLIEKKALKGKIDALSPIKDVILSASGIAKVGVCVVKQVAQFTARLWVPVVFGRENRSSSAEFLLLISIRALTLMETIILISICQDIKDIRDEKELIFDKYNQCDKMLTELKKF